MADEVDRVGDDHRYAAEVQFSRVLVAVDDAPDLGDVAALPVLQFPAVGVELGRHGVERRLLVCGEFALEARFTQLVALFQQAVPGFVAAEVDLDRRGSSVRAYEQVAVHRARQELLLRQGPVRPRALKRRHFVAQVVETDGRAADQGHVQQAGNRLDVLHGRNLVAQRLQIREDGFAEQVRLRRIRDDQVIIGTVACPDRTVVFQRLVVLEHQRIGGRVEPEGGRMIREERHHEGDDRQRQSRPFQNQAVIGVQ